MHKCSLELNAAYSPHVYKKQETRRSKQNNGNANSPACKNGQDSQCQGYFPTSESPPQNMPPKYMHKNVLVHN